METANNTKRQLDMNVEYIYRYYPARIRNVGEDAADARELIWAFKDAVCNAFEEVALRVSECLADTYGEKVKDMVLVCIPTSVKSDYEKRFCAFCQRVSELSGIGNGFAHICVLGDREAVHKHRRGTKKKDIQFQQIDIDAGYFKGKEVCVFDDIITTGKSYADFSNMLENAGANVVGGVFLGKTFYKYRYYDVQD